MNHNMYNHISPCVECQGGCHGVSEPAWITACCSSGPGWLTSNPGLPVDDANNYLILLDVYFSYLPSFFVFFNEAKS